MSADSIWVEFGDFSFGPRKNVTQITRMANPMKSECVNEHGDVFFVVVGVKVDFSLENHQKTVQKLSQVPPKVPPCAPQSATSDLPLGIYAKILLQSDLFLFVARRRGPHGGFSTIFHHILREFLPREGFFF